MSLQARDFFSIYWMHPIPGVYVNFAAPEEQPSDESESIPTHAITVTVVVAGMQAMLNGRMTVSWDEEQFAQHDAAAFLNIITESINSKLLPFVQIVGNITIAKL